MIHWRKNANKYLVFDYTCEDKEVLERYTKLWDGIKNEVETINSGKDFVKMKLDSDDNLPLNE